MPITVFYMSFHTNDQYNIIASLRCEVCIHFPRKHLHVCLHSHCNHKVSSLMDVKQLHPRPNNQSIHLHLLLENYNRKQFDSQRYVQRLYIYTPLMCELNFVIKQLNREYFHTYSRCAARFDDCITYEAVGTDAIKQTGVGVESESGRLDDSQCSR